MNNRTTAQTRTAARPPQPVVTTSERYLLFLATSLLLALGLGFVLAILLPLAVTFEAQWGLRWQALAQVHGHVQVVGFAGCFIIGMAYRLVPRFSGMPLSHGWTVLPVYGLLLAALLLRAATQPLTDNAVFTWGPAVAGVGELGAAILFCLAILSTLRRPLQQRQPWAAFMAAGASWFLVQAAFGAWFLSDLSRFGGTFQGLPGGRTVLPEPRDSLLLTLQIYGFLLGFIFGVATRAVPTFFAHRPAPMLLFATWSLLQVGLILFAAETLVQIWDGAELVWLQVTGLVCLGMGLLGVVAATGVWKPASRLRATARSAASMIKAALFWCAMAGLLDIVFALQAWAGRRPLPGNDADAVRHILTVGVVTTLIVAMAHLVVPALATQRLTGATARRRLFVLQSLLIVAVLLRAVPPLVPNLDARTRFGLMDPAGLLAWLAIALFAWVLWRARHEQGALLAALTPVSRASAASEPEAGLDP